MPELLDTPTLAIELDASEPTIISWRRKNVGPDFVRIGRLIRYKRSDVDRWLEENTQRHTPRPEAKYTRTTARPTNCSREDSE